MSINEGDEIKIAAGSQENYESIESKDSGTLYFTDENKLYLGDRLITNIILDDSEEVEISGDVYVAYTVAEKTKLEGIEEGANKIILDLEPTTGSSNGVTSGAVKTYVDDKIGDINTILDSINREEI